MTICFVHEYYSIYVSKLELKLSLARSHPMDATLVHVQTIARAVVFAAQRAGEVERQMRLNVVAGVLAGGPGPTAVVARVTRNTARSVRPDQIGVDQRV